MIVVLTGRSASGKSTIQNELIKKGFKKIVTVTTRPPREGEVDGVDYQFVSEDRFKQMASNEEFAEWYKYDTVFGSWYYGSLMEDYNDYEDDLVIVLTPEGLAAAKEAIAANFVSFYLFVSRPALRKRLKKRGDNPEEVERRMKSDDAMFENFKADYMVLGEPKEITESIIKILRDLNIK